MQGIATSRNFTDIRTAKAKHGNSSINQRLAREFRETRMRMHKEFLADKSWQGIGEAAKNFSVPKLIFSAP